MTELQSLYQKKGELIHEMRDIYASAEKRGEGLNVDEEAKWAKVEADLKVTEARIEKGLEVRKMLDSYDSDMSNATASTKEVRDAFTEKNVSTSEAKPKEQRTYGEIYDQWIRHGEKSLTKEERGILTQITTAGSPTLGGYLSPETWANEVVESMKAYGAMLEVGNVYYTTGGDVHHIPTEDTTTSLGFQIAAQDTAIAVTDTTWGEKVMNAFEYTSGIIKLSEAMLSDDAYNATARVQGIIARRLGRVANRDLTIGTGISLPFGVTVSAANSSVVAAADDAITRSELVRLLHSVDPAYRKSGSGKVGFMFNDSTMSAIRQIGFGSADDRPLWQPSMRVGEPDTIEGFPYFINQDMASMAIDAKAIIFGDFSNYWIRIVKGLDITRSSEFYWNQRAIAYKGVMRFDGLLVDTASVKYLQMAAS